MTLSSKFNVFPFVSIDVKLLFMVINLSNFNQAYCNKYRQLRKIICKLNESAIIDCVRYISSHSTVINNNRKLLTDYFSSDRFLFWDSQTYYNLSSFL